MARDGEGRNGLYTAQLLLQMSAARNQPIETVLKRVVSGVKQGSNGAQEPWWEGSIEGDFCFAGCRGSDVAQSPPLPSGAPPDAMPAAPTPAQRRPAAPRRAAEPRPAAAAPEAPTALPPATVEEPGTPVAVSLAEVEPLWFTHAFSRTENGRVVRLAGARVVVNHVRTTPGNGGIFSVAESPGGELYFCDATEARIFKIEADHESVVYQHHTPVKHLEFGPNGHLYFSSVMGSRDAGTIYEFTDGRATPYYSLKPDAMPGTWAGTFAFDAHGMLWLSSGPQRPASLYRVRFQQLEKVFTTADTGIMGFGFLGDGSIVYADNAHGVMHLLLPSLQAGRLFESPYEGWLTDVKPVRVTTK